MSVIIICQARLTREMLFDLFVRAPMDVRQLCETVAEVEVVEPGDVVVLDGTASLAAALTDLRALRGRSPWAQVVLIRDDGTAAEERQLRAAGMSASISLDRPRRALLGAVWVVQAGLAVVQAPPDAVPHAAAARPQPVGRWGRARPTARLSSQEARILDELLRGGSNKDIARALGIAEATVKVHLRACYGKIGVANRTQAALWAATPSAMPA